MLLPLRTLPPNHSPQVSHTHASNIIHHNALPHPRHPPPDPLRAQSNTHIHKRDYIIHALPRRPHEHLDSARMVGNHTCTYYTVPEQRLIYERGRPGALARQRAGTDKPSNLINVHVLGRDVSLW